MSIGLFILNPKNSEEESFYLPFATEPFFRSVILKAAGELDLSLLSQVELGWVLDDLHLSAFLEELQMLHHWAELHLDTEEKRYLQERVRLLMTRLPEAFLRNRANLIYIG